MSHKTKSPQLRRDQAFNLLKNEKHPFVSQSQEFRLSRSTVCQKKEPPANAPLVQSLLKKCKFLEELVQKSRFIIQEKDEKIHVLVGMVRQRDQCFRELQIQSHKLMEERQILIDHITQLEAQLGDEEEIQSTDDQYQHHMTNLNDLRYFLNQIRQSNEDIPVFVDLDQMTYEQLLQLEDTIGYVNRGMTDEQINEIPKILFKDVSIDEQICSVCQNEFNEEDKCRVLQCNHIYHSKCIKQWLKKEKHCPICKKELISE
ncbi:hypothetical protein pb186bvf_014075 [Paramecium bursaria]